MSSGGQSCSTEVQKPVEKIKRPLNAFILWSKKRRRVIANENPQMHNFDISRKLGLEWQKLSEGEKAHYFEEAKQLKEEHKQQYPNYKYQPRKRDKTNKRSKLLHGSPFHFSFFPGDPSFFDGRCHLPIVEPRGPLATGNIVLHSEEIGTDKTTSSIPHTSFPGQHATDINSPGVVYPGFRQTACEGFMPYRAAIDPTCMQLRPAFDFSALNWYQSSSARVNPYCSRVFPWHHSRPAEYHS